jgi:hypothetical protein
MKNNDNKELIEAFSAIRLRRYQREGDSGIAEALERYQENIRLSASLLPALHYLEVILRNRLDQAIRTEYGANWLLHIPASLRLEAYNCDKVASARADFIKEKRRQPMHDDIVASMTFGFWFSFFHKRYDPILWHRRHFFASVFPNWPREERKRQVMQSKLSVIKKLRNRIAHHEPIIDGKPSAEVAHNLCIELIGAMSLTAREKLRELEE